MSKTYSSITIPLSDQDCHEIVNDGEFWWTFPTHEEDDKHIVHVRLILEGGENDIEEEDAGAL